MKPGYWTTEFWLSAAVALVAFIAVVFNLSPSESGALEAELTKVITAIAGLVSAFLTIRKYIESRTAIKLTEIQATSQTLSPTEPAQVANELHQYGFAHNRPSDEGEDEDD